MTKLIIDAEMPKSCWTCEIGPSDQVLSCPFYNLSGEEQHKEEYKTGRHPDCPIGELVMCGACKRAYQFSKGCVYCDRFRSLISEDGFCDRGERKENDNADS